MRRGALGVFFFSIREDVRRERLVAKKGTNVNINPMSESADAIPNGNLSLTGTRRAAMRKTIEKAKKVEKGLQKPTVFVFSFVFYNANEKRYKANKQNCA